MNCERAREIFPELLDHRTAATAHLDARAHLAGCPDCQREFSALSQTVAALDAMPITPPTPRLRQNFYAMLEEEKNSAASVRAVTAREHHARRVSLWRWLLSPVVAAALLSVGYFAGARSAPAPLPVASDNGGALRSEVVELRKKVEAMGQLVGYTALLQQQQQLPANARLRGVLTAARREDPDQASLNDLIGSLLFDPSTNVRLRAVDALYPHADQEIVRAGVLASLPREQNPLVQVAMIDFLAAARDADAAPALEKISANDDADQSVRDAARRALTQL
jgi:predicted anti-sigma-YlaC factor YlaD